MPALEEETNINNAAVSTDLTTTVITASREQIRGLLGVQDAYMKMWEDKYPVRTVVRDSRISLTGPSDAVAATARVIEHLLQRLRQQGTISAREVAAVLEDRVLTAHSPSAPAGGSRVSRFCRRKVSFRFPRPVRGRAAGYSTTRTPSHRCRCRFPSQLNHEVLDSHAI